MTFDGIKNFGSEHKSDHPDKTKKVYKPPTLTVLDTFDIETGSMNVPENSNGLLES